MNTSTPHARPLQLPALVILLTVAALVIAAAQWLAAHLRLPTPSSKSHPVSREFAERFGMQVRIAGRS